MEENRKIDGALKKLHDEFVDTGGYSRKMIYTYVVVLIFTVGLGWIVFPVRLWIALLCLLLSLPSLFLYRSAQYDEKVFGRWSTPPYWRRQSTRLTLIATGLSLLILFVWLAYPFIQSTIIIVAIIVAIFWIINRVVRYHASVTAFFMDRDIEE
ncbi:MAG: hypothetical protein ABID54_08165 [Pseudomonadota bacterium]